jgi:exodeoxyribonuclease III
LVTIASFNVNSLNARLENVMRWLATARPDIVCLQELKCLEHAVPRAAFLAEGYEVAAVGQKAYNGVAIASRNPMEVLCRTLAGDDGDEQARYIEVVTAGLRVASIYLPNGNPVASGKFPYKLAWLERLHWHASTLLEQDLPTVLAGDFNVIPEPRDCYDPRAWVGDALFAPESRRAFRRIVNLGFYDAFRALHPEAARAFTFWDYQAGAFQHDHGIRIDHLLCCPRAVDRLQACIIDKAPRSEPRASDHTPIMATFA